MITISAVAVCAITGCGSPGPTRRPGDAATLAIESESAPTRREITADWNDVEASALVGVDRAEATVRSIDRGRSEQGVLSFDLLTVRDESGTLTVTRAGEGRGAAHERAPLLLECVVVADDAPDEAGASESEPTLRNRGAEERIVSEVARRLGRLRGVEFAPVR